MSFRIFHKLYITLFLAPGTLETNSKVIFFIIFKSRRLRNLPFNCRMLSNVGFNLKSCCSEVGRALPSMRSIFWIMTGSQVRVLKSYCLVRWKLPSGFCMNQVSHCGAFATLQEENVTFTGNSLAERESTELTESFLFRPLR